MYAQHNSSTTQHNSNGTRALSPVRIGYRADVRCRVTYEPTRTAITITIQHHNMQSGRKHQIRPTSSYKAGAAVESRGCLAALQTRHGWGRTRKNSLEIACQGSPCHALPSSRGHQETTRRQCQDSLAPAKTLLISRDWLSGPDSSRETSGSRPSLLLAHEHGSVCPPVRPCSNKPDQRSTMSSRPVETGKPPIVCQL